MRSLIPIPGAEDGAMTEVALALAMGFFSILVLALVSIGGGEIRNYEAIHLVETAPESAASMLPATDDIIVIFDGERFFDTDLTPLDPAAVASDGERRIVLAVAPTVQLDAVMSARGRFASANLVIANLDSRWRAAIEAAKAAGDD
jgi:hypothetical protein